MEKSTIIGLVIYLLGVFASYKSAEYEISRIHKKYNSEKTYGDIAFCCLIAAFSWGGVVGTWAYIAIDNDFWKTKVK